VVHKIPPVVVVRFLPKLLRVQTLLAEDRMSDPKPTQQIPSPLDSGLLAALLKVVSPLRLE
jgi:hypothetical protein